MVPPLRLDALMTLRSLMPLGETLGEFRSDAFLGDVRFRETLDEMFVRLGFLYVGSFLSESDSSGGCCKRLVLKRHP